MFNTVLNIAENVNNKGEVSVSYFESLLIDVIERYSDYQVIDKYHDGEHDAILGIRTKARVRTVALEVKSRAWPNELEAFLPRQLREIKRSLDEKAILVLAAPAISAAAAEACRNAGVSWIDSAGNCDIRISGTTIRVEGRPAVHKRAKRSGRIFYRQGSRLLVALLDAPGTSWTVRALAEKSGISLGLTSMLIRNLTDSGYLHAARGENRLVRPEPLLKEWAANYKPAQKARQYFTLEKPTPIEKRLCEHGAVLAEYSAAERIAPFTRYQRVSAYAPSWDDSLAVELGLRISETAHNVFIYQSDLVLGAHRRFGETTTTSALQTYLDLFALGGRGPEAAQFLLDKEILSAWTGIKLSQAT